VKTANSVHFKELEKGSIMAENSENSSTQKLILSVITSLALGVGGGAFVVPNASDAANSDNHKKMSEVEQRLNLVEQRLVRIETKIDILLPLKNVASNEIDSLYPSSTSVASVIENRVDSIDIVVSR